MLAVFRLSALQGRCRVDLPGFTCSRVISVFSGAQLAELPVYAAWRRGGAAPDGCGGSGRARNGASPRGYDGLAWLHRGGFTWLHLKIG
jgi:hypothetical protein